MIASVHVADLGVRSTLAVIRKAPKAGSIEGLRQANVAFAAPLGPALCLGPICVVPRSSRSGTTTTPSTGSSTSIHSPLAWPAAGTCASNRSGPSAPDPAC
jgi:hypothetical protein